MYVRSCFQSHFEVIDYEVIMGDLALCDTWRAIHMRRPILVQAMPVQTCRFIAQMIPYRNNKSFAFRNMESRYRPLAIYAHNGSVVSTIRVTVDPRDIEFEVRHFRACCAANEK